LLVYNFKGGGVLDHGLVQEEIRFLVSPELIISRLLCPKIEDHEAILIVGSKQFSSYEGYGNTFKFSGNKVEKQIGINTQRFRKSAVLAINAMDYS
jgi:poly(ADP-ribose) glycohydrolase